MMHIEQPYYFFGLLAIPVLIWIYIGYRSWRIKALQRFGDWLLVKQIIPGNSKARSWIKLVLPLLSFSLIIAGLSNIQSGNSRTAVTHQGIDLAIVLDVSNSMLAEDAKPNRLEAARRFVSELIDRLPDEKIALIIFAGKPVLMTPLTIDHSAAQLMLYTASPDDVPEQGSDIAAALEEAVKTLPENQHHYRAAILISDGEQEGGSVNEVIRNLTEEQVVICTAGVGSGNGATIPEGIHDQESVKHDRLGKTVITKFNPEVLQGIASKCHGIFVNLSAGETATDEIVQRLDAINKNMFDEELLREYESRFQWFLLPALLILFIDVCIGSRNRFILKKIFSGTKRGDRS